MSNQPTTNEGDKPPTGSASAMVGKMTRVVHAEGKLPQSGMAVVVYKAKGRDILRASRAVNTEKEGSMSLILALAALKCEFDGRQLVYEDILELEDLDVFELIGLCMGKEKARELLSS